MSQPSINIYAGTNALQRIKEEGIHPDMFNVMAGASGGPKWFTLYGLDCYLFGEFFKNRQSPLFTIGSSAGSWRMACFGQKDPVAAVTRLANHYSNETYTSKPDRKEITDKGEIMLDVMLGNNGAQEIINNPTIQSHFIVARAKGLNRYENPLVQAAGLLTAATANAFSRKTIQHHFERFVFHSPRLPLGSLPNRSFFDFKDLPTKTLAVTEQSLKKVLMASGSIPLVLSGVKDIPGAPLGTYRDGGIIDYHLDLDFQTDDLVLYPHFFPMIKPGWFDKGLKNRNASSNNMKNVVVITPSSSHVENLPYQKISDRKDFQNLDEASRIKYWQAVLDKSHLMAEDFKNAVSTGKGIDKIIPIESIL